MTDDRVVRANLSSEDGRRQHVLSGYALLIRVGKSVSEGEVSEGHFDALQHAN